MRVLVVVIVGRWSEFGACIVCQVVRLYSVVCRTLVGVSVFSMMCSELLIMSEIR